MSLFSPEKINGKSGNYPIFNYIYTKKVKRFLHPNEIAGSFFAQISKLLGRF